jgi:hypothetical protein
MRDLVRKWKKDYDTKDQQVIQLQQDIIRFQKQIEILSKEDTSAVKSRMTILEQQNEEKDKVIAKQNQEIQYLKKKSIRVKEDEEDHSSKAVATASSKAAHLEELEYLRRVTEEKSLIEKAIYNSDLMYTNNISNSAAVIFRSLLNWKAFQTPTKVSVLADIVSAMETIVKVSDL